MNNQPTENKRTRLLQFRGTRLVLHWRHPEDVKRIRDAMNRMGYEASDADIEHAYARYSDDEMCAGWLFIDSGDEHAEDAAKAAMRYLSTHDLPRNS